MMQSHLDDIVGRRWIKKYTKVLIVQKGKLITCETTCYWMHEQIVYMKLFWDTKFDKRKGQQIKGMGERTGNTIIWKQTIL